MQIIKSGLICVATILLSSCAATHEGYEGTSSNGTGLDPDTLGQLSMLPPGSLASKLAFNAEDVRGAVKVTRNKTRILRSSEGDTMMLVYYPIKQAYPSVANGIYNAGLSITHRDPASHSYTVLDTRNMQPVSANTGVYSVVLETQKYKTKVTVSDVQGKHLDGNKITKLLRDIRRGMGEAVVNAHTWHSPIHQPSSQS